MTTGTQVATIDTVRDSLIGDGSKLRASLPEHMKESAGDFIRLALVEFRRTPALQGCAPESVVASVLDCARLGLKPGPLGHVYFVPYGKECQLIIGYRGLIALALRSGDIAAVEAHPVFASEVFAVELGSEPKITHTPDYTVPRAPQNVVAVYAIAHRKDGRSIFDVMTRAEIEAIRNRSKARGGPWSTDWIEMARKTVVKRAAKYWDVGAELAEAIAIDNAATGYEDASKAVPAAPVAIEASISRWSEDE